jgi:hypothetical protein
VKVRSLLRRAAQYRATSAPAGASEKGFPAELGGDLTASAPGAAASVAQTPTGSTARLFRKNNTRMLRLYSRHSSIVRSALDIYGDAIERAEWKVVPADSKRPMNKRVKSEIEALLKRPNPSGESYGQIQRKATEDYLVVGLGAIEKQVRRNLTPYRMFPLDAARLGVVDGWDGLDPKRPRYAQFDATGRVSRWLPDSMAMVLVNRPTSYSEVGWSHVEALDTAIRAVLEGDDTFLQQMIDRTPGGALDLGEGVGKTQVDQVRQEIQAVRKAFIVMGGSKNPKFVRFEASERDIRALDKLMYFKRQVAAIFQVPTAMLGELVDSSRANTDALLENADKGPGALLWRRRELENAHIVERFGPVEEHNCLIDYPIMNRRDEKQQAEITSIQMGRGKGAWVSTNDARRAAGLPEIELRIANDVLVPTSKGPIPLSVLEEQYFGAGKDEAGRTDGDGGGTGEEDEEDEDGEEKNTDAASN